MTAETRLLFVMALERCYQHECNAARLYRALAAREQNVSRRTLLLNLAADKERHARQCAVRVEQRGMPVSAARDSLGDRLWRWVLVRSGLTCALAWTEWVEYNDRRLFVTLLTRFAPALKEGGSVVRTDLMLRRHV
jgi:hypothetical protein